MCVVGMYGNIQARIIHFPDYPCIFVLSSNCSCSSNNFLQKIDISVMRDRTHISTTTVLFANSSNGFSLGMYLLILLKKMIVSLQNPISQISKKGTCYLQLFIKIYVCSTLE